MNSFHNDQNGFTLIELLIAMAIGTIVISGIYSIYNNQQKVYNVQGQITDMQQNARMVLDIMTREIRMAGYNPTQAVTISSIVSASSTCFKFNVDWGLENGVLTDTDEVIEYCFDSNNNRITRETNTTGAPGEVLVDNIMNLSFSYDLIADGTGPSGGIDGNGNAYGVGVDDDGDNAASPDESGELYITSNPGASGLDYIRGVQINIIAMAEQADPLYTNSYVCCSNYSGYNSQYTNYRTTQLVSRIKPRNLGL